MSDRGVPPDEVERRLAAEEDLCLLDCRQPEEVEAAAIEGALHIPMRQVPDRVDELDPDRPTVVFCHHHGRSPVVAGFLERSGFADVRFMIGGIDAWAREIDPDVPRYD